MRKHRNQDKILVNTTIPTVLKNYTEISFESLLKMERLLLKNGIFLVSTHIGKTNKVAINYHNRLL